MVTNEQLFGACMNAHGWYLRAASQIQAESEQRSQSQADRSTYPAQQPKAGDPLRELVSHQATARSQSVVVSRTATNRYLTRDGAIVRTVNCKEPATNAQATLRYNPDPQANPEDNTLHFDGGVTCSVDYVIH
jgi:hypothetical protein